MDHLSAAVYFMQKAGMNQRAGMLRNGFQVSAECVGKLCNRNPLVFPNGNQNGNTSMISRSLEVPFQLFWFFHALQS